VSDHFRINLLKYKGDFAFAKRDFAAAAGVYLELLKENSKPNSSIYREVMESLVRCYKNNDALDEALELSITLVS